MNKFIWIGLFVTGVMLLNGCSEGPKKEIIVEEKPKTQSSNSNIKITYQQNSSTALDWAGTYKGIIPCADCDGIETIITIQKDNTYVMKTRYLGKSDKSIESSGAFTWDAGGNSIFLSGMDNQPNKYLVAENTLLQLNKDGSKINTSNGNQYLLTKQSN